MPLALRCAYCGQFLPEAHAKMDRDGRTEIIVRHVCSQVPDHAKQGPSSVVLPVEQDKAS